MLGDIIPTRVGTRLKALWPDAQGKDHPHACGDKSPFKLWHFSHAGSSPRVWGQVVNWKYGWSTARIIPTRVGTRMRVTAIIAVTLDHPHACGDKLPDNLILDRAKGSSPRVWGQDFFQYLFSAHFRIIPTRVGTSLTIYSLTQVCWDHPHACGDKIRSMNQPIPNKGSSPRVWGQGKTNEKGFRWLGIIPTRVGTSYVDEYSYDSIEDHPHACGDKNYSAFNPICQAGSSPRVWGQVSAQKMSLYRLRIIPTRVGTRLCESYVKVM